MYQITDEDQQALDAQLGKNTPVVSLDENLAALNEELPKHADRIKMWVETHKPHQKLPYIVQDEEMIWLNRAARRKLKMK